MKNDIEKQAEAPSSPTTMTTVIGDDGDKSSDGHAEPNIDTHVPCHETHQLPPDGGWYAWSTVAGCFLALFVQFGIPNSYGVFQSYYETHLLSDHSPQDISWIGGIQQFLLFFGGLFAGRAMDAYGAHAVFLPGSFLLVLSLMLTSISTKYWQIILAQGVLFGLGSALIFSPAFSLPSQWFHKRRALATSVAVTGSGLGGTLWPIVFSRLFQQIGFPWALRTTGFIALALLGLANVLIHTRLPRRKPSPLKDAIKPFREPAYTLLAVGLMLACWCVFNPFFYISLDALRLGASESTAMYCVSFLNAGSTVGRLAAGIADKLGRFNVLAASACLISILLLAFWIPLNTVPALIGFAVVYGFIVGFVISLIAPAIAMISKPDELGARVGLVYSCGALFVLTGPPICGALLSAYPGDRGWDMIGVFSGVTAVAATIFILLARFRLHPKLFSVF